MHHFSVYPEPLKRFVQIYANQVGTLNKSQQTVPAKFIPNLCYFQVSRSWRIV